MNFIWGEISLAWRSDARLGAPLDGHGRAPEVFGHRHISIFRATAAFPLLRRKSLFWRVCLEYLQVKRAF